VTGWLHHRRCPEWITRHFALDLDARDERRMRRHLVRCDSCRALYETQMLLEGEGAEAASHRRDRLSRTLFGAGGPRRRTRRAWAWPAAAALATLLLVLVLPRVLQQPRFRSKGALDSDESRFVSVTVYARADGKLVRVGRTVASGQPMAFAYSNRSKQRYDRLLLFAIDERYQVYWYYPAWTDPGQTPGAVPIRTGDGIELPEQVSHDYGGSHLRLFALFTRRRDLTVRTVEQAAQQLRRRGAAIQKLERFPIEGTGQHSVALEVEAP